MLRAFIVRATALAFLLLSSAGAHAQASYLPAGVQQNVPVATVTSGGWNECYRDTYDNRSTPMATILASCGGERLMMACRATGSNTLSVLAQAPRVDVIFDTGTSNTTRSSNGVEWYFNQNYSWGFAPGGQAVSRNSCDVAGNENNDRICWHTGTGGGGTDSIIADGYRCGNQYSFDTNYERIIYSTDGTATVPAAPTAASATAGNTQATVSFTAPANDGGSPITGYRVVSSPGNVQATGSASPITVTGLVNGTSYTVTVFAINAEGDSLPSAPSNAVVPVGPPTLSNFADINRTFGDADFALTPPSSDSAGAFTYTSSNPAVATVSGGTVTIVGAGTSTITANQAANGGFTAGSTSATLTVAKAVPVVTWIAPLSQTFGDADFALPAPSSSSPAAFSYASSNPAVATISGNTVTLTGAGMAILTASQPEGANHLAGSATVSLTVATADPGLSGFADLNRVFGQPDFVLSPPASASAGAFTYTSSNPAAR